MVDYDHPPKSSRYFNGTLYQRMNDDLQLAGMSKRTVHGYLRAVRQLADYCQCRPNRITEAQLRRYFLYLKNEKQFAYGSIRVAFSGIKFYYSQTCKRSWQTLRWLSTQSDRLLPVHHFLVTFTVPDQLRSLLRGAPRESYSMLFDTGSQTIRDLGESSKYLKGCTLGFFGVLHTCALGRTYWLRSRQPSEALLEEGAACQACGGRLRVVLIIDHHDRVLYQHSLPYLDSGQCPPVPSTEPSLSQRPREGERRTYAGRVQNRAQNRSWQPIEWGAQPATQGPLEPRLAIAAEKMNAASP